MDASEILTRIESGEGPTTEFKRGLGDLSSVGRAVCAFANTEGGVIVLGVDDERQIVGVRENHEAAQERLTQFLQSGCSSPVSARTAAHRHDNGWLHWIEVHRQRGLEPLRYAGRVWVRRQRASVEPSATELQELYNLFGYILTEERALQGATASHIDVQKFRGFLERQGLDVWEPPQPPGESDLKNRGVLVRSNGALHATLYGVLAFGKEPQRYPQTGNFRIECVAYAGEDRAADALQVADATGCVDDQVQRALGWFASLGRTETYHHVIREDRPLLPRRALREALVNAVAHRDYAITGSKVLLESFTNRIVVTSPGPLPNHMQVDSARAGANPRSRNELLANFMLVSGFMESRGRGWPLMRAEMRRFNGTEPSLEQDPHWVRVTFALEEPNG